MNTSATGGYLQPVVPTPPIEDNSVDAVFQQMIVGITGLIGTNVIPRWQPIEPKQYDQTIDWCSFGVTEIDTDAAALIDPDTAGLINNYARHEDLQVDVMFYGPNNQYNTELLRDGLAIPQNQEAIETNLIKFISCGKILTVPDLVNQIWVKRRDIVLRFRRKIERQYQILGLQTAGIQLNANASNGSIITDTINVPPAL